jgi:hypothetical protein
MSRDFDKAQEMVVASMEYVKVLGFRIRRTEVQRDDWKKVALFHADEVIKLRQHVDALKAERDAEREALGIQAAKEAGKALGMVEGEGLRAAAQRVVKERDALRTECDDLRRVFSLVHGSLGIQQGEHIGNAIDALKKERDELATRLRQSIARGDFAEMRLATLAAELETEHERHRQTAAVPQSVDVPRKHPVPCDPPEATHITPDGKATAQAAVTPQPGDVVRLVRVPTLKEYPHDSGCWEPNWGGIDDHMRVHYVGSNITGTRVVRAVFGLEWPVSCVEIVKGGE